MKVGKDPANRDLGASGPYTFDEVAVLSTQAPDLQVCTGSKIGESCSSRAAMPGMVKCFASSTDTIDVEWEAANSQGGGLLTGYRVTAFDREDQVVAFVNSTAETRVTFAHGAVNANQRVKYSIRYSVDYILLYYYLETKEEKKKKERRDMVEEEEEVVASSFFIIIIIIYIIILHTSSSSF